MGPKVLDSVLLIINQMSLPLVLLTSSLEKGMGCGWAHPLALRDPLPVGMGIVR